MQSFQLPTDEFSVYELQRQFSEGQLKGHLDAINYINLYYFEVACANYYFYDVNKRDFIFKDKVDFASEVIKKVKKDKDVMTYFAENARIFKIVQSFELPRCFSDGNKHFINLFGGMLHTDYLQYTEYSIDIKNRVQLFMDYMLEISCNNDPLMLKALLLYYSQIARGKKTKVIVIKKSTLEGLGKSTEYDFISEFVFGRNVCCRSNSDPLTTPYNLILANKLLVMFEELPTFSSGEWLAVSSKLKTYCTEDTYMFADKNVKSVELSHFLNFQINSNVESVKNGEGRRYTMMEVSGKRKGDYIYFQKLRDECFNNEVGEAFYSYLRTIITDEESNRFNGQRDFPITENKMMKMEQNLATPFKFLRDEYLLKGQAIPETKRNELYMDYCNFCRGMSLKTKKDGEFYSDLKEISIPCKQVQGNRMIYCSLEILQVISRRDGWINEFTDIPTPIEEVPVIDNEKELLKIENANLKQRLEKRAILVQNKFKKENEMMKAELEQLRAEMELMKIKKPLLGLSGINAIRSIRNTALGIIE